MNRLTIIDYHYTEPDTNLNPCTMTPPTASQRPKRRPSWYKFLSKMETPRRGHTEPKTDNKQCKILIRLLKSNPFKNFKDTTNVTKSIATSILQNINEQKPFNNFEDEQLITDHKMTSEEIDDRFAMDINKQQTVNSLAAIILKQIECCVKDPDNVLSNPHWRTDIHWMAQDIVDEQPKLLLETSAAIVEVTTIATVDDTLKEDTKIPILSMSEKGEEQDQELILEEDLRQSDMRAMCTSLHISRQRNSSKSNEYVSQNIFDEAVLENINEFEMDIQDAINDASQQFEMQDLDCSKCTVDHDIYVLASLDASTLKERRRRSLSNSSLQGNKV